MIIRSIVIRAWRDYPDIIITVVREPIWKDDRWWLVPHGHENAAYHVPNFDRFIIRDEKSLSSAGGVGC